MAHRLRSLLIAALFCLGGCSSSRPSASVDLAPPIKHDEDGIVTLREARAAQPHGVIDRRRTSELLPALEGLQADEYPAPLGNNAVLWSGCDGQAAKVPALLIAIDPFERLQDSDGSQESGFSRELAARAAAEQGLVVLEGRLDEQWW